MIPFGVKGKACNPAIPPRLPVGPAAMFDISAEQQEGLSRLIDMSVVCRYLAAQCLVRQGKWAEATEMLGEANPFRDSGAFSIMYHNSPSIRRQNCQDVVGPRCPIPTEGLRRTVFSLYEKKHSS